MPKREGDTPWHLFGGQYGVHVLGSILPGRTAAAAGLRCWSDLPFSEPARVFLVRPHPFLHVLGSGSAGPLEVSEARMGARGRAKPYYRSGCCLRWRLRQRVLGGKISTPAGENRKELLSHKSSPPAATCLRCTRGGGHLSEMVVVRQL